MKGLVIIVHRSFQRSLSIGLLWAEIARSLSDKLILPLNAIKYADMVKVFVGDLGKGYGDLMADNGVSLGKHYVYISNQKFVVSLVRANCPNKKLWHNKQQC